ncbi:translation elongation factor EF1A/initiation factor IF2gamma family protein [Actinidia rufa]|uniref:Translation elongation factor EF1A/initiation factor IF2gamma family protein n=1 Tax=Actinidia rufa TaxID=165716 RepID=A0A7J0GNC0_9ERIC|nr:translation elongation factor EF1A/initiation factor IF2gamma family protein [Actinidia rufa]
MISGASQADASVLVISARKGNFETGYERGGQTREHVQLANSLGVSKLLVVVNKMDDPAVNWSKESALPDFHMFRYLLACWIKYENKNRQSTCPWWNGPCLFEALDAVEVPQRDPKGPFRCDKSFFILSLMLIITPLPVVQLNDIRLPIIDKFKDMGTVFMGTVHGKVLAVYSDEDKVRCAGIGGQGKAAQQGSASNAWLVTCSQINASDARPSGAVIELSSYYIKLRGGAIVTQCRMEGKSCQERATEAQNGPSRFIIDMYILAVFAYSVALIGDDVVVTLENSKSGNSKYSMLFLVHVLKASIFVLPKRVIKAVESVMRVFLWSGTEMKSRGLKLHGRRFVWIKKDGGLGIKSLEIWNKAVMAKHIWFLFTGECLMDLKEIITTQGPYIKRTIGDGPDTFLWLDNWHPVGSILKAKGEKVMSAAALGLHFRVSYIFVGNRWRWPCTESLELMKLQRDLSEIIWGENPTECLMDLKEIITTQGPYIKRTIGDGPDTFLWLDNWHPVGSILKAKGEKVMSAAALGLHFRVSYIFVGNRWRWPCTESLELMKLQRDLSEIICPRQGVKDEVAWILSQKRSFTNQSLWDKIRVKR